MSAKASTPKDLAVLGEVAGGGGFDAVVHDEVLLALGEILWLGGEGSVAELLEAGVHEFDHFGFDAGSDGLEGVAGLEGEGFTEKDGAGIDAAGHEVEGEANLRRSVLGFEDRPLDDIHAAVGREEAGVAVEDAKAWDIKDGFADEAAAGEDDEVGGVLFEGVDGFGVVVVWDGEDGDGMEAGEIGEGLAGEAKRIRIVNNGGLAGMLVGLFTEDEFFIDLFEEAGAIATGFCFNPVPGPDAADDDAGEVDTRFLDGVAGDEAGVEAVLDGGEECDFHEGSISWRVSSASERARA